MTNHITLPNVDEERAKFEKAATALGWPETAPAAYWHSVEQDYSSNMLSSGWAFWKARAALAAQQPEPATQPSEGGAPCPRCAGKGWIMVGAGLGAGADECPVCIGGEPFVPTQAQVEPATPVKTGGDNGHPCSSVTYHRGGNYVCQRAGHGVGRDSCCKDCPNAPAQPAQAAAAVAWREALIVARDEIKWWAEEHSCCGGHEDAAMRVIDSAIASAPAVPAGWPTIDSAPKDGTWVLIARPEWDQAVVAKWAEYPGGMVEGDDGPVAMFGWVFRDHLFFAGGMEDGFLGWKEDAESMPTHWTHALPAAHSTQATGLISIIHARP